MKRHLSADELDVLVEVQEHYRNITYPLLADHAHAALKKSPAWIERAGLWYLRADTIAIRFLPWPAGGIVGEVVYPANEAWLWAE